MLKCERPSGAVDITILDLLGNKVYYNLLYSGTSTVSFRVPASFSKETHYILEVRYGTTVTHDQIFFK